MLIAGQLLLETTDDPIQGGCRIVTGMVRVEEDRIIDLILGELSEAADVGGPDCLVTPGLIDAHLHLPQFCSIGAHGLTLLDWLDQVIFPAEAAWEQTDVAIDQISQALTQCLLHGTTGICAWATVHQQAAAAALHLTEQIGLRGLVGQVLMDRGGPPSLTRPAGQLIDESAELLELFPPGGRVSAAVTPRFALACTPELLNRAGRLATERQAKVQTHMAETALECAEVERLFDGRRYLDVYDDAGLVGTDSIVGHAIHLDAHDRARLAKAGALVAHCPTANSFLRSGTMDLAALHSAGVGVVLGSDIGAGYERSMVRVARAMIEAAAAIGGPLPTAGQAWHAITTGAANALGWDDGGRLAPGAVADILVIRPNVHWLTGPIDPLYRLLFSWDDRWLAQVLLRGQRVY